jgi:hypothetical protein
MALTALLMTAVKGLPASEIETGGERKLRKISSDWKAVPKDGIISASGGYRLQKDVLTDRTTGIDIRVDNATLDLGGHTLRYIGVPKEGTYGITVNNRNSVTISNGTIGGFWFNIHCIENQKLTVRQIRFDNIPYLGLNVVQSKHVLLTDNSFSNFRYDLTKPERSAYLVAIILGAECGTISRNRFAAQLKPGDARQVNVETVFVLLSADVSKNCLVTQNEMTVTEILPRSYGVWLGTKSQATIVNNFIRNTQYGVCLSDAASAFVCSNRFTARSAMGLNSSIETFGISVVAAGDILESRNQFDGVTTPLLLHKAKRQ